MIRQETVATEQGRCTRVTFELPKRFWAESVHLVGDFNEWCPDSHPFQQRHDGSWWISVDLGRSGAHHFMYLVDGDCWLTDGQADDDDTTGQRHAFVVRAMEPAAPRPRPKRREALPEMPRVRTTPQRSPVAHH